MGWLTLIVGLALGAVASGGLTYSAMLARELVVVDGARKAERDKGVQACNVRVLEIERIHNASVAEQVEAARKAAEAVRDVPEDDAGLIALCKASASCRSRERLP